MPEPTITYKNVSIHEGINTRLSGRLLSDTECTDAQNVDISVPGVRSKRLGPSVATSLVIPSVIQNVCVAAVPTPTPVLSWFAAAGAVGFVVTIYNGAACGGTPLFSSNQLPNNVLSYTVPTGVLSVGNSYSWTVTALGDGVNTQTTVSPCCSFTVTQPHTCTPLQAPVLISPVQNFTVQFEPVGFNWSVVPNASGYVLNVYDSNGNLVLTTAQIPGTSTIAFLTPGQSYTWTVTAIGDGTIWCTSAPTAPPGFFNTCTFTLSGTSASYDSGSHTGTIGVTTNPTCQWTSVSNNSWLHITSGSSVTGSGSSGYSVDANSSSSPRTGTITIASQTYTVTQAGQTCISGPGGHPIPSNVTLILSGLQNSDGSPNSLNGTYILSWDGSKYIVLTNGNTVQFLFALSTVDNTGTITQIKVVISTIGVGEEFHTGVTVGTLCNGELITVSSPTNNFSFTLANAINTVTGAFPCGGTTIAKNGSVTVAGSCT